jgi:large subunit ribosomal protein L18
LADGPRYSVPFRRRREGKTDYKLRRGLIRSGLPRAVVRVTNQYVYVQIVEAGATGDFVRASAASRELGKAGWKGGNGNIPSAYLTGILAGRRALARGVKEAILDIGLRPSTKGSKVYAALKGLAESGLKVPYSPENIPVDDRIGGKHVAEYAKNLLGEEADLYKKRFSGYLRKGLRPEELAGHFAQVKQAVQTMPVEFVA